jgi:N6-adenosine-specific RNA methylase IME4
VQKTRHISDIKPKRQAAPARAVTAARDERPITSCVVTALKFHPLAGLFPLMEGAEFDELRDDIKQHGLLEPLCEFAGKLLDGRNRLRACKAAGIPIPSNMVKRFDSKKHGDPLTLVISKNLKRRHLNESQRAWVASKLANMRQGERTDLEPAAKLRKVDQAAAALMLNVSERSIQSAAVVFKHGTPELQHVVEQGDLAVSVAANAARLPADQQREVAEKAANGEINVVRKVIKKYIRKQKESELGAKQLALPDKKFGVILADPEWKFEFWSEGGMTAAADNHYATSALDEIKKRDVPSISADDCVLFLWATVPMLPQALEVMAAWGFKYVSGFAWMKNKAGTGYWTRNQHEHLLVGVKGKPVAPALGTQWSSVIEAAVGKHSEKPEESLEMIESYFPTLPKIELNRRGPARDGWDAWGAEVCP